MLDRNVTHRYGAHLRTKMLTSNVKLAVNGYLSGLLGSHN